MVEPDDASTAGLAGRAALVTGAAGGIGAAISRRLHAAGARLVLVDRAGAVEALSAELGGSCAIRGDVTVAGTVEAALAAAEERGGLRMLVNVAGVQVRGSAESLDPVSWDRLVSVNLTAAYRCCQRAAPLLARRGGAIVNISSLSADRAISGIVPYGALKAALSQLTRGLAVELGPSGVRVNAVAPGYVVTEMTREMLADPQRRADILRRVPLGRLAEPEDIAPAVEFLLSDTAAYITGAVLAVDGGYAVT